MAKLRNRTQGYTIVPQTITKDTRLDLRDSGLLLKMLSLPDNWDFSEKGLKTIIKDGLTTIRTGLKHLEQYGYLKRSRVKNDKGQFIDWEWEIFSEPLEIDEEKEEECENGGNEDENRNAEIPVIGKTELGKTELGKQTQLNTKELNTKKSNTKDNNIIIDENFEKLWKMLQPTPNDRKAQVKPKRKKELYEMGTDRVEKAIHLYLKVQDPKYYHKRDNFFNNIIDNYLDRSESDFLSNFEEPASYDLEAFEKQKFSMNF